MARTPTPPPPDNSKRLRQLVREVLKTLPKGCDGYSFTALHARMRELDPSTVAMDTTASLQWNFRKGNATFVHDEELELDLWHLTARGLALT